jgi:hypothetical protein
MTSFTTHIKDERANVFSCMVAYTKMSYVIDMCRLGIVNRIRLVVVLKQTSPTPFFFNNLHISHKKQHT